ncbi:hypothetical protein [Fusobacterium sp.]|uniref:hypothetical protein n=1 Tax=Fusobacterium sp. TaxID=68766 RepID=UPI002637C797|nr:hypothetical protein [Fusobacterium sp.]
MEDKKIDNFTEKFKSFFDALGDIFQKENAEKEIPKLIVEDLYNNDIKKLLKNFYIDFIIPLEDKLEMMLPKFQHSDLLLSKILLESIYLEADLKNEISIYNGTRVCCADESRTIMNGLINLLLTGKHSSLQETYNDYWERLDEEKKNKFIDFKGDTKLTYWSCKRFKNTEDVMEWIKNKYYE